MLHISDLHADISVGAMRHLVGIVGDLDYDICVLTGDYRGRTFGPFDESLSHIDALVARLRPPIYGILGNHDTIRMTPALEAMGIKMLFNECATIARGDDVIHLAGVDDAHFYRADDIGKVATPDPGKRVLDPAVAYAGDLPGSGGRGVRSHAERPHPWRPALPARRHPDQARGTPAAIDGTRRLALCGDGRLYLGRRRHQPLAGAVELPAGNHAAHAAL